MLILIVASTQSVRFASNVLAPCILRKTVKSRRINDALFSACTPKKIQVREFLIQLDQEPLRVRRIGYV